jgi:hypothetical protein
MTKLINAFLEMRTLKNAARLTSYLRSHPMAECMATEEHSRAIAEAAAQVANGTEYQPA